MADLSKSIEGAKLCGASARWFGKPIETNPYDDLPGWLVLRAAWAWGWHNSEAVLEAEATGERAAIEAGKIEAPAG